MVKPNNNNNNPVGKALDWVRALRYNAGGPRFTSHSRTDMSIQTDHVIEHRRPDIIVVDKDNKRALLIDIAVPADARVE